MKTRIASFDVGINHMAYAILEKNGDNIRIIDMDLICIFDENRKVNCCGTVASGDPCTKNSKFTGFSEPKTAKTSKKKKDIKSDNSSISIIKSESSDEEIEGRMYYCSHHAPDDAKEIKKINTKTVPFGKLSVQIAKAFSSLNFKKCNKIVIEHQPSMASKRMQFVSHAMMYELCKSYLDQPGSKCTNVSFAPRDKMAAYDGPPIETKKVSKEGTKTAVKNREYRKRKSAVIQIANYFFDKYGEEEWKEWFESSSHDKQDDLSDAYVQGITAILGAKSKGYNTWDANVEKKKPFVPFRRRFRKKTTA